MNEKRVPEAKKVCMVLLLTKKQRGVNKSINRNATEEDAKGKCASENKSVFL